MAPNKDNYNADDTGVQATLLTEQEARLEDEQQRIDHEEQLRLERETLRDIIAGRVREHIYRKQPKFSLRQYLNSLHFADIGDAIECELNFQEGMTCLDALTPTMAANIVVTLNDELKHDVVTQLNPVKLTRIIRAMPADDAVDVLQLLSAEEARRILGELPQDADTRQLRELLIEAPDTAAGIMSTDYMRVPDTATVDEALEALHQADEHDFIYYIYLVDAERRLTGVISIKDILLQRRNPERALAEIAITDLKYVYENFDQELVANLFRKYYNLLAMPVLNEENQLLGIITLDDVIDVIDEESQEDLYRTSGINLTEEVDEKNLLTGRSFHAVKARIPWLAVTLVGQLCVASIIGMFNGTVSQAVRAFSFLPLLCGLSGNIGTQSDTISVRGIALDIISPESIRRQVFRELRVALAIGGIFATVLGVASYIMYHHALLSSLLAGYVLISNCISAVLGVLIPYTIKFVFRQDPAGVGGPFITTTMDLLMYISYLYVLSQLGERII